MRSVQVRVSKEHAEMLKDIQKQFCYPSFTSASAWLTKQVKEAGIISKKEEDKPKERKFSLRI